MPNYRLLNKFLPAAERELAPVEKTVYNKAAIDALKREAEEKAAMEAELIAQSNSPEQFNSQLSDELLNNIDQSSLPKTSETGFELVGTPQSKDFTLGQAGEISRPPVLAKQVPDLYRGQSSAIDPEVVAADRLRDIQSHTPRASRVPEPIDVTPIHDPAVDVTPKHKPKMEIDPDFQDLNDPVDTLSSKLNNTNIPDNDLQSLYKKYRAMIPVLGTGVAATYLVNSPNGARSNPPASPTAGAPIASTSPAPVVEPTGVNPPKDANKDLHSKFKAMKASKVKTPVSSTKEDNKEPQLEAIDFGQGQSIASDAAFLDAQDRSNKAIMLNRFGEAMDQVRAGLGQGKVDDPSFWREGVKGAQDIPKQYLERVKFEKEDPNSPMSKGYKELAKAMGYNITGKASAADLEKLIPQLSNMYTQREARKARAEQAALERENKKELAHEKALDRQAMLEASRGTKMDMQKNKFIEYAQKSIGKEFEKYQKIENSLDSLEQAKKDQVGASDVTMLYNFIKAQDPDSVVREGEIALGQRGMSLGGRIRTMTLGQLSGEMLDPKFRNDIVKIARRLKDQGYTSYNQSVQTIRDTAQQRYGMSDDELSLIDPVLNRQKKKKEAEIKSSPTNQVPVTAAPTAHTQPKSIIKKGYNPSTNKTQLIYSDGTKEIVNGRR